MSSSFKARAQPGSSGEPSPSPFQASDGHLVSSAAPSPSTSSFAPASSSSIVRRTKTTLPKALESKPGYSSISGVYFFNGRGNLLVQRHYRDGMDHANIPALYRSHVTTQAGSAAHTSGGAVGGVHQRQHQNPNQHQYQHQHQHHRTPITVLPNGDAMLTYRPRLADVTVVAVTSSNSNCMMVMQFLAGLVQLIRSYAGGAFHEEVIVDNFILVLELLDDALDYGYPQLTDPALAKGFIYQKPASGAGLLSRLGFNAAGRNANANANTPGGDSKKSKTMQVTGAVGWRDGNVKYKRNEVYLDIVESISALLSSNGDVLRAEVDGRIVMRSCLSGMPEVKLGLVMSDGVQDRNVQNVTFHPCVNPSRNTAAGDGSYSLLSFVPPDGEFELAKYRGTTSTGQVRLPFTATALMTEQGRTRIDVTVKVRSAFASNVSSSSCVVLIPVPKQTARAQFQLSTGKAKYDPQRNALVWKVKKFVGGAEHTLVATVELISTAKERERGRAPMSLHFQLPNMGVSGVQVRQLQVWEKSAYKVEKWVRWNTRSESYEIRMM